jgi:hypothetical protein
MRLYERPSCLKEERKEGRKEKGKKKGRHEGMKA